VGVFGFLSRAHLEHLTSAQAMLAGREAAAAAEVEVGRAKVADLDTRIAQIDAAVSEATKRGRTRGAMDLAADQRKIRDRLSGERESAAKELARLQVVQAAAISERARVAAEVGPIRYLATLAGGAGVDPERAVRIFTLSLVLVLDPLGVALLLAASV
jgi:chromosome segregation ATPase